MITLGFSTRSANWFQTDRFTGWYPRSRQVPETAPVFRGLTRCAATVTRRAWMTGSVLTSFKLRHRGFKHRPRSLDLLKKLKPPLALGVSFKVGQSQHLVKMTQQEDQYKYTIGAIGKCYGMPVHPHGVQGQIESYSGLPTTFSAKANLEM